MKSEAESERRAPQRPAPSIRATVALFVVALGVLTAVAIRSRDAAPAFLKYPSAVEALASGEMSRARILDFSPLYLGVATVADRVSDRPATWMLAMQTVLAALVVALLFVVLARRVELPVALFGAGVMLLLNRDLLVHQSVLEPELLMLTLIAVFLVLVGQPFSAPPGAGRREMWVPLAVGVVGALAMWTRPNLLPVLALVPLAFWIQAPPPRRALRMSALFALPVALGLALLMARSAVLVGDPLAPAMSPGTVFFEGNHPLSSGTSAAYPPSVASLAAASSASIEPDAAHRHYREVAAASVDGDLDVRGANAFWQGHATAFLRAEPGFAVRRWLDKLTLALNQRSLHDTVTAWQIDRSLVAPTFPFALLAGLALVGMLLEARNFRSALLFYALAASQLGLMMVFYVSARQRLAMVPALVYFAAIAVEKIVHPGGRRWAGGLRWALLALLVAACVWLPQAVIDQADDDLVRASAALRMGATLREDVRRDGPARHRARVFTWLATRPDAAVDRRPAFMPQDESSFAEQMLATVEILGEARGESRSAPDRFDLAVALFAAGRLDAADRIFAELMDEGYRARRPARPHSLAYDRARIAFARGDDRAGLALLDRALEVSPGDPFSLALMVAKTGSPESRAALDAYWSRIDADWLVGRAALEAGNGALAIETLERVVEALPSLHEAQLDLAAALARAGRDDQAVARFLEANQKRLEPVLHDPTIPDLFRRWRATDPSAERTIVTAQVLHVYGYMRESLSLLESVLEDESADSAVAIAAREQASTIRAALSATR